MMHCKDSNYGENDHFLSFVKVTNFYLSAFKVETKKKACSYLPRMWQRMQRAPWTSNHLGRQLPFGNTLRVSSEG